MEGTQKESNCSEDHKEGEEHKHESGGGSKQNHNPWALIIINNSCW